MSRLRPIRSKSLGGTQASVFFPEPSGRFQWEGKVETSILDKRRKKSSLLAWICPDATVQAEVSYKKRNTMTGIYLTAALGAICFMSLVFRKQDLFLSFQVTWIPEQKGIKILLLWKVWSFNTPLATHRHAGNMFPEIKPDVCPFQWNLLGKVPNNHIKWILKTQVEKGYCNFSQN